MPGKRGALTPRQILGSPFLTHLSLREDRIQPGIHPFTIPLLEHEDFELNFTTPVTFLVGENGSRGRWASTHKVATETTRTPKAPMVIRSVGR
jgi:hypothetical protein